MVERGNGSKSDIRDWSVDDPAVAIDVKAAAVVSLHHPAYPFRRAIDTKKHVPTQARVIAVEYLTRVAGRLFQGEELARLGTAILAVLGRVGTQQDDGRKPVFRWLDVAWGISPPAGTVADAAGEEASRARPAHGESGIRIDAARLLDSVEPDPRGSYWVARQAGDRLLDATLVLHAGFVTNGFSHNGGQGLRVVMHVDPPRGGDGPLGVRVIGADLALDGIDSGSIADASEEARLADPWKAFENAARELRLDAPAFVGYGYAGARTLQLFIVGSRAGGGDEDSARSYSAVVDSTRRDDGTFELRTLSFHDRVTNANGRAFPRDPASAGPSGRWRKTRPTTPFKRENDPEKHRHADPRLPPPTGPKTTIPLEFPEMGTTKLVQVRQSRLEGGDPAKLREVDPTAMPLRSDDLGAAHAYIRGRDLFDRMSAYGLQPLQYFRFAKLPLVLGSRAPISPGARDGQTVNAQVRPLGNGLDWDQPFKPATAAQRPQIVVRFAAADLSHRRVAPNLRGRRRAQFMGLAADPRWAWHEFGHVLSLAATGGLELRFAHSIGDALAAVAFDAESELAHPAAAGSDNWRGVTFPWVAIPRRHDRKAEQGWSWSSRRYADESADPLKAGERYRAYFAEQLLSSAIFRLYLAIGGDSSDAATRCGAADYVVYLLMQTLALLGQQSPMTATAADFVRALMKADTGTTLWDVDTPWNAAAKKAHRVGGCVHKVVRWAFEQQGLQLRTSSQPPLPDPPADLYIVDRRRPGAGDGGYWSVPLAWSANQPQPWHANAQAMSVQASELLVQVRNRGPRDATGVSVSAWCRRASQPIKPLLLWDPLQELSGNPAAIPAGNQATYRFDATPPAGSAPGSYFVVAAATCAQDRSNIDPAAGLPCTNLVTPLVDLIANDNNLGFAILPLP